MQPTRLSAVGERARFWKLGYTENGLKSQRRRAADAHVGHSSFLGEKRMFSPIQLKQGVYLVEGAYRSAIYDTNTGKVYSINQRAKRIILGEVNDEKFLHTLVSLNLIDVSDYKSPVNTTFSQANTILPVKFIWFEVTTSECNERCVHCYANSAPIKSKEFFPVGKPKLTFCRWKELVHEGANLGAKACQFIGGEPFLYRGEKGEDVLDLAQVARHAGYDIVEIYTNGTLLTGERIQRIKELGVEVAVSLYSVYENVHDAITRTPGSFRLTMRALKLLKSAGIPTRVETIILRANQHTIDETLSWVESHGFKHRSPDVLRPIGRGQNNHLLPDSNYIVQYGLQTTADFHVDADIFIHHLSMHPCLSGKLVITETGDVLPCVFSRNQIIANVSDNTLRDVVFSDKLQSVWRITKDDVLVCQDCEYRYACSDCRPIAYAGAEYRTDYSHAPYPLCTYNPYTGEWGNGLWRVDENGVPFYERQDHF